MSTKAAALTGAQSWWQWNVVLFLESIIATSGTAGNQKTLFHIGSDHKTPALRTHTEAHGSIRWAFLPKNRSGPSLTCCPAVPPKESRVPTPSRGQPLSLEQHEGTCAASLAEAVNQTLALSRRNCICYLCYST